MEKSLTTLRIADIEIYAYHGVKDEENKLGGRFQVDVDIEYDATEAAIKDDLSDALNYEEVLYQVHEICSNESYKLIETLTLEILTNLVEKHEIIERITVRVRKFNIPFRGILGYVESEQTFSK